jgi:hypothetical protein
LVCGLESKPIQAVDRPLVQHRRLDESVTGELREEVCRSALRRMSSSQIKQKRCRLAGGKCRPIFERTMAVGAHV